MGKVLVLGSDNRSFLTVIRSLGRRGLRVHVGWCAHQSSALYSKYVTRVHNFPWYSPWDDAWKRALVSAMQQEEFDLVIPCNDQTLIPLQYHKADLEQFGRISLLGEKSFEIAFDKLKSYELARSQGIPVPRGVVINSSWDAAALLSEFNFPLIVKPRATYTIDDLGYRNSVRKISNADELASCLGTACSRGPVLVQQSFTGTGVGVELLAHQGEVLVLFQHVRIHEPLTGGGSTYRKSVPVQPELGEAARKLMKALAYTGVAMVEFKVNFRTGEWVFIEINGRFWGSLPLAVVAGVDFPYYLYELLVEQKREFPQRYKANIYCRNLLLDAAWMLQNFRAWKADASSRVPPWSVAREVVNIIAMRERSDTFVLDDPRPGLVELGRTLRARFRKLHVWLLTLPPIRRFYMARAHRALAAAQKIVFVCKGNINRSPFAQHYATRVLPPHVEVLSYGYYPTDGRTSPQFARAAAAEMGVELATHRSRIVTDEVVRKADVIFVFDEEDYAILRSRYPSLRPKLHLLGILLPEGSIAITDPWRDIDDFRTSYEAIGRALDTLRDGNRRGAAKMRG